MYFFEDFQDGHKGGHLGYQNWKLIAIPNLNVAPMPASKFCSTGHTIWEKMLFKDFQNGCQGCHTGYWNEIILIILNLHSTLMLPTKFNLNLTYASREDVFLKNSKMATMVAILDI